MQVPAVRVLAIHGSPRRGGNTDILLNRAMEGAVEAGAQVEHLYAAKLRIAPCAGCGGCEKAGRCVLDDGMQAVYPLLEQAHRLVLASPVYFYGVTAQLKALIDRCQVFWSRKYVLGKAVPGALEGVERRGYVISVAASAGKRVFDGVLLTARIFFDALNLLYGGELLVAGVDEKGGIKRHRPQLDEALALGRGLGKAD
jgi:multimeric flavodoxin WrbA